MCKKGRSHSHSCLPFQTVSWSSSFFYLFVFIYCSTTLLLFCLTAAYMVQWVLYVACMHKWWGLKRFSGIASMDVSVLTHQTFSGTVMILWCSVTLTCLINTVCELLLASHFWAASGCFMVGPRLSCLYSYTVYVPTSKTYDLLLLCIVIVLSSL